MPTHSPTEIWWWLLCAITVVNLGAWVIVTQKSRSKSAELPSTAIAAFKLQALLSFGYVIGCGYRSVFPVFDVQRICMFDTWFSSVLVGRSVATVAELCFAAQWALLLRTFARASSFPTVANYSTAVVPMIMLAELFSWFAVVTTSNIGHVIEESIWGLCAAGMVVCFISLVPRSVPTVRPFLIAASVIGSAYVFYMFDTDVPMYWARWVQDEAHQRPYLTIVEGFADTIDRRIVSLNWSDWKSEVIWMTLYFSIAVWLSIALVHLSLRWQAAWARTDTA